MTESALIPAMFCYFVLIALFYLVTAIALIICQFAVKPAIVYLSNKNYQRETIKQGLFFDTPTFALR